MKALIIILQRSKVGILIIVAIIVIIIICLVVAIFRIDPADSVTKRWTPNVDFEDPNNWDANHVPSSVDVAVFQEDTAVPVVLPTIGVDVCELLFPINGQLILEPNAKIVIHSSSQDAGGCMGKSKFDYNMYRYNYHWESQVKVR